ncbi:hypothetical protein AMTR_s00010p00054730 [Amborella trichopoda]|uniref:Uncharacterized protein n=1 Tax=Amborella trichopoda TaxID=13333 RepID=W1NFU2_AMBTC|nr:hypothetical protein AMTR_s00010p00054730 [Amborella trichopoda]
MGETERFALFTSFSGNRGGEHFESRGGRGRGRGRGNPTSDEKDKLKCTTMERLNTRETCWDLVGRPRRDFPRTNSATINESTASVTQGKQDTISFEPQEELVTIPKLLDLKQQASILDPSSSFKFHIVQSRISKSAHHISINCSETPWIIDSRATKHMAG